MNVPITSSKFRGSRCCRTLNMVGLRFFSHLNMFRIRFSGSSSFGAIFDLYIARKRDRGGNRFGFISMLDVKDKNELLKNLRGIRMDAYKLWFNIARFVLEDGEINTNREKHIPSKAFNSNSNDGVGQPEANTGPVDTGARSFRDMLVGRSINIDSQVNAFSTLHGRALVARMVNVDALKHIYVILDNMGHAAISVQYLGGLDVLLSFEDAAKAVLVHGTAITMKEHFSAITFWEGQCFSFERLAWLKIQGVPLHLSTNEVFDMVGRLFGTIVHKANRAENDRDLRQANFRGDHFELEEPKVSGLDYGGVGDWVPDFVTVNTTSKEDGSINSDSDMEEDDSGESESEESESEDVPVTASEKSPENDDVITGGEEDVRKETIDGSFIDNYEGHSSLIKDGNVIDNMVNEGFVPAVNFDFEQSLELSHNSPPTSKVVKRKKCKKNDMGRSSTNYVSSNESLKVVKKPKSDDDIFGLNSLLGLDENNPVPLANVSNGDQSLPFDLNSQPLPNPPNDGSSVPGSFEDAYQLDDAAAVQSQLNEVEATKILGEKLGVDLIEHDRLIHESLIQEGLQLGGMGFEFEYVNSIGNSGGILSVWDTNFFSKDQVLKYTNFLLVSGMLADRKSRMNFLNVYAPQNNPDKRNLGEKISRVIQAGQGWWIIFGDFNAVRDPSERKNSVFDLICAKDFNDFVDEAGLREFDLKGKKYTYLVNRCGEVKLSRIDRVFVCENVFNKWSQAYVRALKRGLSDHAPLLLSLVDTNFGPKPFRWFDSWLDRQGCVDIVNSVFGEWVSVGPYDMNLTNKLKAFRERLKTWFKECKRKDIEDEQRLKQEKEDLEVIMEHQDLEESDLWVWSECVKCLQEIDFFRTRDIKQKSRVQWAYLGDENSSFFHNVVKGRQARNAIPGLEVKGEWVSKPSLIKREVLRFFRDRFKEDFKIRPVGMEDIEVDNMLEVLGCKRGTFPFDYLGLKVGAKMSRINNWNSVIDVDRLKVVNGIKTLHWEWTTAPTTSQQVADLFSLLSAILDFDWKGGIDEWKWSADRSGLFSVNSVKKLLISNVQQLNNDHFRWKEIWSRIEAWCRLSPTLVFQVSDLLKTPDLQNCSKHNRYILRAGG
ncbi:RNA-directed DNA polymerase, eukaryota [Artemisia annua]|uniref:RNA-directed DNA polymerase, eukaryota n=1 Tax=Artemisia annua TaxID=35608 RepID=A0A2U1MJ69_ARTAN|nr:RNA-directed DNA polymerase, eukaryota [Artemisia annua]